MEAELERAVEANRAIYIIPATDEIEQFRYHFFGFQNLSLAIKNIQPVLADKIYEQIRSRFRCAGWKRIKTMKFRRNRFRAESNSVEIENVRN